MGPVSLTWSYYLGSKKTYFDFQVQVAYVQKMRLRSHDYQMKATVCIKDPLK